MHTCDICSRTFESGKAFGGHKVHCRPKETCTVCGLQIASVVLQSHLSSHSRDTMCKQCGSVARYPNTFCSSSCSASFNNVIKAKKDFGKCPSCSAPLVRSSQVYCSNNCQHDHTWKTRVAVIESTGMFPTSGGGRVPKKYLREKFGCICSICKTTEWQGQPVPLVMDHIDGNSDNWSVNNIRMVCGNCDMLLPTYKNKNNGNGRAARRQRYAEGQSY